MAHDLLSVRASSISCFNLFLKPLEKINVPRHWVSCSTILVQVMANNFSSVVLLVVENAAAGEAGNKAVAVCSHSL